MASFNTWRQSARKRKGFFQGHERKTRLLNGIHPVRKLMACRSSYGTVNHMDNVIGLLAIIEQGYLL